MRRENEVNRFFIISIVVVAILVISLVGFLISKSNRKTNEREFASKLSEYERDTGDLESASTEIGKTVEESKNEIEDAEFETLELEEQDENTTNNTATETNSNAVEENTTNEIKPENTNKNTTKNETKQTNAEAEKEVKMDFEAPIKGKIIREFAKDSLVFSNTLQEWITHTAIDVKADKTSVVKSAAAGTVYAIKNDPRYGLTVIINHDNGFQTVYSNLLTAEFVVKGEKVEKGQTIGTVGNSAAFETSDEDHLHFELLRNNEYLDPVIYMSFE